MNRTYLSFALLSAALGALPVLASADPQYQIRSIDYAGADFVSATAIAGGYISGNAYMPSGLQGARWTGGSPYDLMGPAGATVLGVSSINRLGDAVGTAGGGRSAPQGVLWKSGVAEYLPTEDGDADDTETLYGSRAIGINDAGVIAGNAETQYGTQGVIWEPGNIRLLMSLDPIDEYQDSVAMAINGLGQVAGAAAQGAFKRAVIWEGDTIRVLGGLGDVAGAEDINDFGKSVGWTANSDGSTSGFYNDGTDTFLLPTLTGMFYGDASAINNDGIIVGYSAPDGIGEGRATMWKDGVAYDLNDLLGPDAADWTLIGATGIDDDGSIIGYGYYNGEGRAFLLRPVPEPASMLALAGGLAALLRRRKRSA
ncbi:MAG: hypothetical protein BGO01_01165 [Armatimonadetes bacterium 55-13]|nr:PEP-CTERM sorting domain-containing protein [Armatimonadota bacterium]OJU65561.1 MAG: hypothetical protein BGO01_01165 [Armatimonadetes bacterium 55-13]